MPRGRYDLDTLLEDDEDAAIGIVPSGKAPNRAKGRKSKIGQVGRRFTRSAAHVRHSVTAKRISVQLVNVS